MPARASNIARVSVGYLNRVMDPLPGRSGTPIGPTSGRFTGQVGAEVEYGPTEAAQLGDPAIGSLFGAVYKYVRFSATPLANTFKRGMLLFWDGVTEYQVTTNEALATQFGIAGVQISPTTGPYAVVPGNYGWIVTGGKVAAQWKAALTVAAAVGLQAQWSAAGAGADNGTIDTLAVATAPSMAKFVGIAENLPVAGGITNMWMYLQRRRI